MFGKITTLLAVMVMVLVWVLLCFSEPIGEQVAFVVSDGSHNVIYDAQSIGLRTVLFNPKDDLAQVEIRNIHPDKQYLEIYSWTTGKTHRITRTGVLLYEQYTIKVRAKDGQELGKTKLRIIRTGRS